MSRPAEIPGPRPDHVRHTAACRRHREASWGRRSPRRSVGLLAGPPRLRSGCADRDEDSLTAPFAGLDDRSEGSKSQRRKLGDVLELALDGTTQETAWRREGRLATDDPAREGGRPEHRREPCEDLNGRLIDVKIDRRPIWTAGSQEHHTLWTTPMTNRDHERSIDGQAVHPPPQRQPPRD